ncbi:hypothetical protein [Actinoplanes sp. L3-i22]|uniref:hypothetical protein n=1 Tax=Actinoplanes sp. L3-i22 TaxID=2836373 RepID=UPI001C747B42|nr:hypothetical protein [Actinoplanes sp. L3-i22]BCY09927.1 hypothetical protein L3i22_050150 [Actinoplanes sp. L3-i22]
MSRSEASGGMKVVVAVIGLGVAWFALTWPYYVFGGWLETAYLCWLVYMAAMSAWYRHGRSRVPARPARPAVVVSQMAPRPAPVAIVPAPAFDDLSSAPVWAPTPQVRAYAAPARPEAPAASPARGRGQQAALGVRLADLPPHGIGRVLLDRLAEAGIRTYADYAGHRIDRSGTRPTVYLVRSDGVAIQVAGIGPDKALTLDTWHAAVRQGQLQHR